MPINEKRKPSKTVLFLSSCVGVGLALLTQLGVMIQHSSRAYVSLLWAPLYPVQVYVTEYFPRFALALNLSVGAATAKGVGLAVSSLLLGIITPLLVWVTRSNSSLARYAGYAALAALGLMAIVWFPMPNGL